MKGVSPRSVVMRARLVWLPFMSLRVLGPRRSRNYSVDVHFLPVLSNVARRAALLRPAPRKLEELSMIAGSLRLEPRVTSPEEVIQLFKESYIYADEVARSKGYERVKHLARWIQLKNFLIPTGHQRHLERDEADAAALNEALWARRIIGLAFMLDEGGWAGIGVAGGEIYWRPFFIKSEGGTVIVIDGVSGRLDRTYTELSRLEDCVRTEFLEALRP